jgi:hypothetical protein
VNIFGKFLFDRIGRGLSGKSWIWTRQKKVNVRSLVPTASKDQTHITMSTKRKPTEEICEKLSKKEKKYSVCIECKKDCISNIPNCWKEFLEAREWEGICTRCCRALYGRGNIDKYQKDDDLKLNIERNFMILNKGDLNRVFKIKPSQLPDKSYHAWDLGCGGVHYLYHIKEKKFCCG